MRRAALSLVFVAILYADLATILHQSDAPLELPIDATTPSYNKMFHVFTNYSERALGFVAKVRVRPRDDPAAAWVWREIDVHELFPMPRGESFVRIFRMGERNLDELARQLLLVVRRSQPDLAIEGLRLYHASWPASPEGYLARFEQRQLILLAERGGDPPRP